MKTIIKLTLVLVSAFAMADESLVLPIERLDGEQPIEIKIIEDIRGDFIEFDQPLFPFKVNLDYSSSAVGKLAVGIHPGEPEGLRVKSEKSHDEACHLWKSEATRRLGNRILRITCGKSNTIKARRVEKRMEGRYGNYTTFGYGDFLGFVTHSIGEIYVYTDEKIGTYEDTVFSKKFPYQFNNFSSLLNAINMVSESFRVQCEQTKQELERQFGKRFLYSNTTCNNYGGYYAWEFLKKGEHESGILDTIQQSGEIKVYFLK